MAFCVRWSEQAAEDLKEIVQYLRQHDPDMARLLAGKIIARLESAAEHALAGRVVPEKGDLSIREVLLNPYRLVYNVDEDQKAIFVVRIWHAARGEPKV